MYKLSTFYKKGVKLHRPSEEEVERRRKEYKKVRLEEIVERILEVPYKKREDGKYDIYGSVDLYKMQLISLLKLPIKFGKVYGNFWCSYNQLVSLEGAPKYVSGYFFCYGNQLKDLKGAPEYVGGGFDCSDNQLMSLEGAPEYVGGNFFCSNNRLVSLEGAPAYVGGDFYCWNNAKKFTEEEVRKIVNVKGEVHI